MRRLHWTMALAGACLMTGTAFAQGPGRRPGGATRPSGPPQETALFERHDTNGDGVLTREEVGERGQRWLDRLGRDSITREEVQRARAELRETAPGTGLGQQGWQGQQRGLDPRRGSGRGAGLGPQQGARREQAAQRGPAGGRGRGWQAAPQGRGWQRAPQAGRGGERRGQDVGGQGVGAQGRNGVTRRDAARELRRDHPRLFRELARLRRQDPQRFQQLDQRRQQRNGRAGSGTSPYDRPPVRDF